MSILESIDSLATGTYTVTRRAAGTWVNGVYTPNPITTTFTIRAVVQPAFNLNRVIGGADMRHLDEGQFIWDTQVLYTQTPLVTRTTTNDPDIITIDGDDWTAFRVEKWDLAGQVHYRVIMSRKTDGAA